MAETPTLHAGTKPAPPEPMSFDAFLEWLDEDVRAEWMDGTVCYMSPASNQHQNIVRFLTSLLSVWSEHAETGVVRPSPFVMRLADRPSGREPDLLYLKNEHTGRLQETYLEGPADLVIEVVSPESVSRDRGEKFVEYEMAGVAEYWLVDPIRAELTVWRLGNSDRYRTVFEGRSGRATSEAAAGFWIEADWLWEESMPTILEVLKTWDIV